MLCTTEDCESIEVTIVYVEMKILQWVYAYETRR